jgi:hypothetical protein
LVEIDDWTGDTAEAEEPQRWTGKSIFMKAGPPGEDVLLLYNQSLEEQEEKKAEPAEAAPPLPPPVKGSKDFWEERGDS